MIGSTWRKWDLHFHTPSSYDYKDGSVTNQDIIDFLVTKEVAVVAITDHHVIDITRIRELQKLGEGKITILPGIEFRGELGGSESIHFIGLFPENCDLDDVWTKLQTRSGLTKKDIVDKGGDQKIYCDIKETCKHIHDLGGLVTVHAGGKSNTLESIKNNQEYKKALKVDLVRDCLDIFELGKEEDQEDYNNIVFPAIKIRRPMIICSDNHNIKNYTVKQNLWIKADPTFEGLKQITFEPQFRIHIGELPPINPPIRINKVTLDFPDDSIMGGDVFCLSRKNEIEFSPNFTCFIGGRGTGKSTILNIIHEKLKPTSNKFFSNKKIKDSTNKIISIGERVSIDNDSDEKFIEFLSQNEIEEFAQDYEKLTVAIYSRILKKDEEGLIVKHENNLKEKLEESKTDTLHREKIRTLKLELEQKEKELATNKKIVDSFTSPEYSALSEQMKNLSTQATAILDSEEKYKSLVSELNTIVENYKQINPSNLYSQEVEKIITNIEQVLIETKKTDFSETQNNVVSLASQLSDKKSELKSYLSGKGLTQENLKDISTANIAISGSESDIQKKKDEIDHTQRKIDAFDKKALELAKTTYKDELEKQIKTISSILETLESLVVKPISLHLDFDFEAAHDRIFADFLVMFREQIIKNTHKYKGENVLKEILFCVQPQGINGKNREQFVEDIQKNLSTSGAKNFLLELFSDDTNFEIYKLMCESTLLNYSDFKNIKVFYDNRPIESSSFGQRCTAVLVILLLLGNNPIIIDEPEAHLDSLLISNYLVEVIKNKKQARQIIFATHNANFVINGDAELIYILGTDAASGITTLKSTTIENASTRETLISLEGGREAFIKRESKYQVN